MRREEKTTVMYRCVNGNLASDIDTCLEVDLLYVLGHEGAARIVKQHVRELSEVLRDYQENKAVSAAAAKGESPDDQGIHAMMSVVWPRLALSHKREVMTNWQDLPLARQQVFVRQAREILRYIEETVKKRANGRTET